VVVPSRREVLDLLTRHGLKPRRALGQHFVVDPNTVRRVARLASVGPGDRVVEVGAGLGSLTLALAETGAAVTAVEVDRRLLPVLRSLVEPAGVRVVAGDAMTLDWHAVLRGSPVEAGRRQSSSRWALVANLPYNIATPLVLDVLADVPRIDRLVVMVQREVGERLVAGAGDEAYGAVSVRVAYRATASIVRRVGRDVFWPRPKVESVVVRLDRLDRPPVDVDEARLWRLVEVAFGQRRKTMRNALRRLGLDMAAADATLRAAGVEPSVRPERLSLEDLARVAVALPA